MRRAIHPLAALASIIVSPVVAAAHPGHGTESASSPWHYLIEPAHGGALLALVAALALYRLARRPTGR